jgi:uncharacterized membrane protein
VVESFTKQRGEDMSKKQIPWSHLLAILGLTAVVILNIAAIAMEFRYGIFSFVDTIVFTMVIFVCCFFILLIIMPPDAGGRA